MDQSRSPQYKGVLYGGSVKVTVAAMMGSVKSAGLCFLLLAFLLYIADSYPNTDVANMGCEECTLRKNRVFSKYSKTPIYQCMGCCFSRAYPTPLETRRKMLVPKSITSEATCCVARNSYEVEIHNGAKVKNHTDCHCSTCYFHKISRMET